MPVLIGLAGMFAVAFLAALLGATFVWAALQVRARRAGAGEESGEAEPAGILHDDNLSTIAVWRALLMRVSHVDTLQARIAEANLKWSPGRVTAAMLLLFTVTLTLTSRISWLPPVLMFLLPAVVAGLPYSYILHRRARRFDAFTRQFPEALDSLSRALRAGYPLSASFDMLALEQPEPLATELRRTRDAYRLGTSWDHALDNLARRVPLPEVRMFAAAVKMQNRMGGKLNDVLSKLSETMRDGAALDSEVRSISAHSRITGMVLTVLPLCIGLMMLLVNPEYTSSLFNTPEGRTMLSLCAIANVAAHLLIRKIVRIRT